MRRWIFLILLFGLAGTLQSQILYRIGPEHADCQNAIELYDTVYGPTTPPIGSGSSVEFNSHKSDLFSFEKEHNAVWYLFEVDTYCDLLLDIIPLSKADDYDFILFRYQGSETCELILHRKITPVRSCISRNDTAIGSRTGLSYDAHDEFIHSGPGASYAKALPVKKGERYLLVLDNVYPNGDGHRIHLKYRNCSETPVEPEEKPSNFLNLSVKDASTFEPVEAQITLTNKSASRSGAEPLTVWESTSNVITKLDQQSTYEIVVKAQGYFMFTDQIRTLNDFQTYRKTALMNKIEAGKSVSFSNILFFGGSEQFLRDSYPVLDNIIQTLKDQPDIELEIIGHVNQPLNTWGGNTTAQNQSLSERRAQAVYNYMVRKGIAASRLAWSGRGNSEMVHPYAANEEEMQANRRVELLIKKQGN
jgi:outer membrane protein OmpA-like peptidoglycan-associated protein